MYRFANTAVRVSRSSEFKNILLVTDVITYIGVGKHLTFKNTYVLIYILHTICIYLYIIYIHLLLKLLLYNEKYIY